MAGTVTTALLTFTLLCIILSGTVHYTEELVVGRDHSCDSETVIVKIIIQKIQWNWRPNDFTINILKKMKHVIFNGDY
jgi:hypothetical protein